MLLLGDETLLNLLDILGIEQRHTWHVLAPLVLERVIALDSKTPELCHLIRKMTGNSSAVLAGASDGNLYVAKFLDTDHPNALFNESAGYELYRLMGLPVPAWSCLFVCSQMIDGNADCWRSSPNGRARPNQGICFGSRFVACPPARVYDILPSSMFARLWNREQFWLSWVVDVLARHSDRRQAVFVEDSDGRFRTVFIDHSHLFGGPDGSEVASDSRAQYFDPRIYAHPNAGMEKRLLDRLRRFDGDAVRHRLRLLPDEWTTSSAIQSVRGALDRISNFGLARSICEELIETAEPKASREIVKFTSPEHLSNAVGVAASAN